MRVRLGFTALLGLLWLGCDSSNPVAPGTVDALAPANQYTITLTASQGSLFAGVTDPVEVTISVLRNSDRAPAEDGQQVSVSTTLGNFGADASNTPITLLTLTLRGGGAGFQFFPGDEPGTAELLARLADSAGSFRIQVVDPGEPPEAAFEFSANGLEVIFKDATVGAPIEWRWDFGDGSTSREQDPTHVYEKNDVYLVTLRVEDPIGRTSEVSQFVEVASTLVAAFSAEVGSQLTVIFTDASEGNPDSWLWQFGDGSTSSAQSPIHTYPGPAEYLVTLTVSKGEASASASQFVVVGEALGELAADFDFEISGLTVIFTNASTGGPTSFLWDFGDETSSTVVNPTHTYAVAGTYVVVLTASNAGGSADASKFVTVADGSVEPVASFTFSVAGNGLTVSFTDTSSGPPTEWLWDFGDGETSDEQNPTHTYSEADDYLVTLTVTNAKGTDSTSMFVNLEVQPEANFAFEQDEFDGVFTDTSTGNPTSWDWDFGDGGTSDEQNPRHTYGALGTYTVKLTVSNSVGSDIVTKDITIASF